MATRLVLVASCLVVMATTVAPQPDCGRFPNATVAQSLFVAPSLQLPESVGLICGFAGFALLVSILFLAVRRVRDRPGASPGQKNMGWSLVQPRSATP